MKKGHLAFTLDGEKLHGRWSLVQIRGRGARDAGKSWLLIKGRDDFARSPDDPPLTETRPESVTTGRGVEDVARDQDRVWRSNRPAARAAKPRRPAARSRPDAAAIAKARRATAPDRLQAELATLVATPPAGSEWLHEMKFDGYRILAHAGKGASGSSAATRTTGPIAFRRSRAQSARSASTARFSTGGRAAEARRHDQLQRSAERGVGVGRGHSYTSSSICRGTRASI
jgi:ATP-dependent DNA ligase